LYESFSKVRVYEGDGRRLKLGLPERLGRIERWRI
jgi:hypothetical protein